MQRESVFIQVRRFAATGLIASLTHASVAAVFIHFATASPATANVIASIVATGVSYVMHALWSFSSVIDIQTLSRFLTVSVGNCILAGLVASTIEAIGYSYWIGIAAVICVIPLVSFLSHSLWTFRR